MYFKKIAFIFAILGVLGYIYGDRIFYFQANMMMRWQYPMPAYEAYERIVRNYPDSPHIKEARMMMEQLVERSPELKKYLNKKYKGSKKREAERAKQRSFH